MAAAMQKMYIFAKDDMKMNLPDALSKEINTINENVRLILPPTPTFILFTSDFSGARPKLLKV